MILTVKTTRDSFYRKLVFDVSVMGQKIQKRG
jgi:hypothetical protein